MADYSIVEVLVYAIICYAGVLGLIFSAFKEQDSGKSSAATRVIWLIPSVFCAFMLASAGAEITLEDSMITSTTVNLNTTEAWQETIVTNNTITLVNPVWVTLHLLFFFILIVYLIINILQAFIKH